jgi:hypothetical protein
VERAAIAVLAIALGGCASISVAPSGAVAIKPGLRNLAVCFDDVTGRLESVIAYKQSRTFAGQNVILGTVVGGVVAGPVGAGAGGLVGLLSEALDSATTLMGGEDPVPSCEPPLAPPLHPDEVEIVPSAAVLDGALNTPWQWAEMRCGGALAPSWCPEKKCAPGVPSSYCEVR